MKSWNLQVILDKGILQNRDLIEIAKKVIEAGATFIQLRDKISSDNILLEEAKKLKVLTEKKECLFIINNRVDIAMASNADGVHLGQMDLPYKEARSLLGARKIIGLSTHNIEQARLAQMMGADYIGVGPIFRTSTKPDLEPIGLGIVSMISKEIKIPVLFIGGIDLTNINEIIKRGGRAVAVASAILNSNNILEITESFVNVLKESNITVAI